jgi:DNA-binding Xre family transcriptional regulator
MAKLGRNEAVHLEVLIKICEALNCNIEEIVEVLNNEEVHNEEI